MNLLSLFTLFSPHRTQISMTHSLTHPPVSNTGWVFLGLTVARFAVQVERWSELSEPAKNDAGAAVWLQPAGSGQFYLYMRVCVCRFSLCQPAGHGSSHWEATYWRAACQWPEKQEEEGKKWDSPPVTGTTTWRTEAAKIPETKKKTLWPDMSKKLKASCLARARVSRYHRLLMSSSRTLWGNIFPPAFPKQSE